MDYFILTFVAEKKNKNMSDDEVQRIQNRKRAMADRFIKLSSELSSLTRNDLLLMRTSDLEELGKELAKCVEHARQLRGEK